ncbi:DNA primase [Candidatus Woesebacteria bacterium]|nr:DNA primase [Candidatus Woesebacteria bacterium]
MSPVDQIKEKLDIVEFIGRYVQLRKAGRNFKANCPFHQENSPSFVVSPDRQIWHCFGTCGTGGDVVTFFMKWESLSFQEALRELAPIAGVQLDTSSFDDKEFTQKEKILSINNLAARYYAHILQNLPLGKKARDYLIGRGLNEKIIATFQIGYAADSWDSLMKYFQTKKISEKDLFEAGLVVQASSGNRYYDRFRNRIIFPIKDSKGNVVGFSGRVLNPDEKGAKYVNTPETIVYHKRESLYGIQLTRDAIRKLENVYIVEGEFDMITPYQHGIENIVAIKGSALTSEQLTVLKRYTTKITLALDTDEAGIEAMKRGIREAEKMDFDIHIVQFTKGKDPDEAARADNLTFKKDLKGAVPIYDFLLSHFSKKIGTQSPFEKKKIVEEMAPYVGHIQNPIVFSYYVKKLAHLLEVDSESIQKMIRYQRNKEKLSFKSQTLKKSIISHSEIEIKQRFIVSYLLQQEDTDNIVKKIIALLDAEDFPYPAYQSLITELKVCLAESKTFIFTDFIKKLPAQLHPVADELFLSELSAEELSTQQLAKIIYELKSLSYRYYMTKYGSEDESKVSAYSQRLRSLNKNEIENQLQT